MGRLYLIPVLKLIFFKLNGIEKDEDIALYYFVKIPQPRHKLRLMYRHDHVRKLAKKDEEIKEAFLLYVFVGWMVFLTVISLLPAEGVALGDKGDKIAHFGAYFITSLLCYYTFRFRFERADIYAVFFAFGYGAILELAQFFVPNRVCSLEDLMANVSGVLFFFILYRLLWGRID